LFLDRSVGRIQLPTLLRAQGLTLVTLAEHYGMPADEKIEDTTWLRDTAALGWACVMKDERIRRRPAERLAVQRHRARVFYFTRGDLTAQQMADRIITNLDAIAEACGQDGPFAYVFHPRRIERMSL
jgi:PIN like domain